MPQAPKKRAYPAPPPDINGLREKLSLYPNTSQTPVRFGNLDDAHNAGEYDPASKTIALNPQNGEAIQGFENMTAAHEFGHSLWHQDLDPFYKNFWGDKFTPKEYARRMNTQPTELFGGSKLANAYPGTRTKYLSEALLNPYSKGSHAFAEAFSLFMTQPNYLDDGTYNSLVIMTGMDPRRGIYGKPSVKPAIPPPKGAR